jgi:hypothetical protein
MSRTRTTSPMMMRTIQTTPTPAMIEALAAHLREIIRANPAIAPHCWGELTGMRNALARAVQQSAENRHNGAGPSFTGSVAARAPAHHALERGRC